MNPSAIIFKVPSKMKTRVHTKSNILTIFEVSCYGSLVGTLISKKIILRKITNDMT